MLDYVALGILVFTVITVFYGIIAIHDIPYEISKHRNHPHQDAIQISGWVSLLTMHVLWPFLWIWASLYRNDRGWGFSGDKTQANPISGLEDQIAALKQRIDSLEQNIQPAETQAGNN